MKRITITLILECRDFVPPHVQRWMAANLAEHAENEFYSDFNPEWIGPEWDRYDGPPLMGEVEAVVGELLISR